MSRPGPTADVKLQAARAESARLAARQVRRDVTKLLSMPEFRRFMADLLYGRLGLKRSTWRANAGETARAAARGEVAAEVLADLAKVDPQGFILLEQEHVRRMAEELEVLPTTDEDEDDAS